MKVHRMLCSRLLRAAVLACLAVAAASAQTPLPELRAFDSLLAEHRLAEAWKTIAPLDPDDLDLTVVLRKGAVLSLSDWSPRDGGIFLLGSPSTAAERRVEVRYALDRLIETQTARYPDTPGLYVVAGNRAWQVASNADVTEAERRTARERSATAYRRALSLGAGDGGTRWRLAVLEAGAGRLEAGLRLMRDAAADSACAGNPEFLKDLAWFQWKTADAASAATARSALDGFVKAKASAGARETRILLGDIALSGGNSTEALPLFQAAYADDPANLYPLRRIIACNLAGAEPGELERNTRRYAESIPVQPESIEQLTALFIASGRSDALFAVVHSLKSAYRDRRPEVSGLMALYEALVHAALGDAAAVRASLDEAVALLGSTYPAGHPVRMRIDELYRQSKG